MHDLRASKYSCLEDGKAEVRNVTISVNERVSTRSTSTFEVALAGSRLPNLFERFDRNARGSPVYLVIGLSRLNHWELEA